MACCSGLCRERYFEQRICDGGVPRDTMQSQVNAKTLRASLEPYLGTLKGIGFAFAIPLLLDGLAPEVLFANVRTTFLDVSRAAALDTS